MNIVITFVVIITVSCILWWIWNLKESFSIEGADLPGNPVIGVSSQSECKNACISKSAEGCARYTWLGPNAPNLPNTCWLKYKEGGSVKEWGDSFSESIDPQNSSIPVPVPVPVPTSGGMYCRGEFCLDISKFQAAYNSERANGGLPPCEWNERVADNCWCIAKYCGKCDNDKFAGNPQLACGVGTSCGDFSWGRVCHVVNEPGGFTSSGRPQGNDITDLAIDAMKRLGDAPSHRLTVHDPEAVTMGIGFNACGVDVYYVLTGSGPGGNFIGWYDYDQRPCPA
jgi:hypothetical protein